MSAAGTYHSRSTRALAWSFALGAVLGLVGAIVGTVSLVVGAIRKERR